MSEIIITNPKDPASPVPIMSDTPDPRNELGRKLRQATQLAQHCANVPHPVVMNDILADLIGDCEELWMEIEDYGLEVRT